jgi:hypothetical protein
MSGGIKGTIDTATKQVRDAGEHVSKQVGDALTSDEAKDIGRTVSKLAEDIGDEAMRIARSEEVESAIDSVGSLFKGLAAKIHESRHAATAGDQE